MPARHEKSLVALTRFTRGEKPQQMGTGVLLELFGRHFLISATHVLTENNLALPGLPLHEAGRIFLSRPEVAAAHSDLLDVGYVLLTDAAVATLRTQGRTFLPAGVVPVEISGFFHVVYVFSGFPASSSRTRMNPPVVESTPTFIKGEGLSHDQLRALGSDPLCHIGIAFKRGQTANEATGERITGPMPQGMSGGAIWLILPEDLPVLVGIGTDYLEDALVGTLIQPLIGHLRKQYGPVGNPSV